jgi:hypothetical protein
MKLFLALGVAAVVMFCASVPAQAVDPAKCAAMCKAYCAKNYPGYGPCQDKCQTRQCSR